MNKFNIGLWILNVAGWFLVTIYDFRKTSERELWKRAAIISYLSLLILFLLVV